MRKIFSNTTVRRTAPVARGKLRVMTTSLKALVAATALVVGGGAIAGAAASPQHGPTQPWCHVRSVAKSVEYRAYYDPTRSGDTTGMQSRDVTTTTAKCRGKLTTWVTYGAWSAPFGFTH